MKKTIFNNKVKLPNYQKDFTECVCTQRDLVQAPNLEEVYLLPTEVLKSFEKLSRRWPVRVVSSFLWKAYVYVLSVHGENKFIPGKIYFPIEAVTHCNLTCYQ